MGKAELPRITWSKSGRSGPRDPCVTAGGGRGPPPRHHQKAIAMDTREPYGKSTRSALTDTNNENVFTKNSSLEIECKESKPHARTVSPVIENSCDY